MPPMGPIRQLCCLPAHFSLLIWATLLPGGLRADDLFVTRPANRSVRVGEPHVILQCSINRSFTDNIYWTKDINTSLGEIPELKSYDRYRVILDRDTGRYDLEIKNVSLEDDGKYSCVSSRKDEDNKIVLHRAEGQLTVLVPPTKASIRIAQHGRLILPAGHYFLFTCDTDGAKPPANITWMKGGEALTSPKYKVTQRTLPDVADTKLFKSIGHLLYPVKKADNGAIISCHAQHHLLKPSQAPKARVILDVLYPPSLIQILGYRTGQLLIAGNSLHLSCQVDKGNPPSLLQWSKDDRDLATSGSQIDETHEMMVYRFQVQPSDNGATYSCKVKHITLEKPITATVKLNVSYGPTTVEVRGTNEAAMGTNVTLECFSGPSEPPADIVWTVDGEMRSGRESIIRNQQGHGRLTKSVITINMPEKRIKVKIRCQAKNQLYRNSLATQDHFINVIKRKESSSGVPTTINSTLESHEHFHGTTSGTIDGTNMTIIIVSTGLLFLFVLALVALLLLIYCKRKIEKLTKEEGEKKKKGLAASMPKSIKSGTKKPSKHNTKGRTKGEMEGYWLPGNDAFAVANLDSRLQQTEQIYPYSALTLTNQELGKKDVSEKLTVLREAHCQSPECQDPQNDPQNQTQGEEKLPGVQAITLSQR